MASSDAHSDVEPMQIGVTHISKEEKERRIRQSLCLYCGLPGHLRASCPTRPSHNLAAVSMNSKSTISLENVVSLEIKGRFIKMVALIDSGAAGYFIDVSFSKNNSMPLVPCDSHLAVAALDGRPLGSGCIQSITEDLQLSTEPSIMKPSACSCSNLHKTPLSSAFHGWSSITPLSCGLRDKSFTGLTSAIKIVSAACPLRGGGRLPRIICYPANIRIQRRPSAR